MPRTKLGELVLIKGQRIKVKDTEVLPPPLRNECGYVIGRWKGIKIYNVRLEFNGRIYILYRNELAKIG